MAKLSTNHEYHEALRQSAPIVEARVGADPAQLVLAKSFNVHCANIHRGLMREAETVIDEIGLKEVAHDLNERSSDILKGLTGAGRHYFRTEWLVWLALKSKHSGLAAALPAARGLDVVPAKVETAEQRLTRIEANCAALPEPMRAFILGGGRR